jgi:hypothetical protein
VRLSETYVRWNRPHKLSANLDIRFDKDAPSGWLRWTGVNVYIQGESGRAYTPYDPNSTNPSAEPNSRNAPFQITTDLRINRSIGLGGRRLDLSVTGTNIFSNYVIYRVDPQTGGGRVWGVGSYAFPPGYANSDAGTFTRQSEVDDPSNYGPGGQWRVALDYDF